MTKFVLVGDGRSGTTWLADMLRHHPRVACLMEPLAELYEHRLEQHQYYWPGEDEVWCCPGEEPVRGKYQNIGEYFDAKIWTLPWDVKGAKLLSFYLSWCPELPRYFRSTAGLKFIWIERNPLRKALSEWYAQKLKNWNVQLAEQVKKRQPSEIPWTFLQARIKEYDDNRKQMDVLTAGRPLCRVYYQDLTKQLHGTMSEVCSFLGIEPQEEYTTDFQKMTPQSFEELVLNWKSLKRKSPARWQKYWERDKS